MLKIALAGAPGTGKARLAAALRNALNASGQTDATIAIAGPGSNPVDPAGNDLTLVMGLDLGLENSRPGERDIREAADQSIRSALGASGVDYRVIYGGFDERLAQALQAIDSLRPMARHSTGSGAWRGTWIWTCDKCSDPQCEQRLLSDLLAERGHSTPHSK